MPAALSHRQRALGDRVASAGSTDARHFEALCRGLAALIILTLPVGLTMTFASPPLRGDGERGAILQPASPAAPTSSAGHAPARHDGRPSLSLQAAGDVPDVSVRR